jgi:hypothetical protein
MWSAMHPMVVMFCFVMNYIKLSIKSCICIPRLEVPDGSYTLVPAAEDEEAGGDVHYVTVEQGLDQSPEGPNASFANEGKPQFIINPCCLKLCNYLCYSMCIYVQELNKTLVE